MDDKSNPKRPVSGKFGIGIAIGIGIGVAIGVGTDNLPSGSRLAWPLD